MKYISLDTETSGTNPDRHQILSIGAVIEDTNNIVPIDELPSFYCVIPHTEITGEPYALSMNKSLIEEIKDYPTIVQPNFLEEQEVTEDFERFLDANGIRVHYNDKITVAGKNYEAFDRKFLNKLPNWERNIKTHRRVIDPSGLCVDWSKDDVLPNLSLCKKRCGLEETVTHNALEDAKDVVRILRKFY